MVRTQIQLTESQARRVKALARREGVSMAEIIRRGVDRVLQEQGDSRRDRYADAVRLLGRHRDREQAGDVARRHDGYLAGTYG